MDKRITGLVADVELARQNVNGSLADYGSALRALHDRTLHAVRKELNVAVDRALKAEKRADAAERENAELTKIIDGLHADAVGVRKHNTRLQAMLTQVGTKPLDSTVPQSKEASVSAPEKAAAASSGPQGHHPVHAGLQSHSVGGAYPLAVVGYGMGEKTKYCVEDLLSGSVLVCVSTGTMFQSTSPDLAVSLLTGGIHPSQYKLKKGRPVFEKGRLVLR